jgi:hypothetical protein
MEASMALSYNDPPEFDFGKAINVDFDTDINVDAQTSLTVDKTVDVDVGIVTNIEGNTAILVADVEAIGKDTFVQLDTSVLVVEDTLSSISVTAIAAVA